MEGMEPTMQDDQVRGVGQAVEIISWIQRVCPDMLPMAPLLQDVMFAGFEESRWVRLVLLLARKKIGTKVIGYRL